MFAILVFKSISHRDSDMHYSPHTSNFTLLLVPPSPPGLWLGEKGTGDEGETARWAVSHSKAIDLNRLAVLLFPAAYSLKPVIAAMPLHPPYGRSPESMISPKSSTSARVWPIRTKPAQSISRRLVVGTPDATSRGAYPASSPLAAG